MIRSRMIKPFLPVAAIALLSACSMFGNKGPSKAEKALEDKAGRIAMVLEDQVLEASPELASIEIALPPVNTERDWPQAGRTASKVVGHVGAGAAFEVAWSVDAGRGSDKKSALTAPPVASETAVYLIDSGQTVRAFDLQTGARLWQHEVKSGQKRDKIGVGGGIALGGNAVIVASGFGLVKSLDASSGSENWSRRMEAPMTGSPTIKDGNVYVTSNNNEIYALDIATGEIKWTDQAIAETARVLGSPSPAAVEEIVVSPFTSGEVIAYLNSNGRRLWADALTRAGRFTPISSINDVASRPVLAGGLVIATSQSGLLAAIDGRSGNRVWALPVGSVQAPALAGEMLFLASTNAEVLAIAAANGGVFWVTQLPEYRDAKDRKGRITYAGPLIASNRVVVASSQGELLALSPQTGEQVGSINLKQSVFLEPIAAGDKILVLTDEGRLIAIR